MKPRTLQRPQGNQGVGQTASPFFLGSAMPGTAGGTTDSAPLQRSRAAGSSARVGAPRARSPRASRPRGADAERGRGTGCAGEHRGSGNRSSSASLRRGSAAVSSSSFSAASISARCSSIPFSAASLFHRAIGPPDRSRSAASSAGSTRRAPPPTSDSCTAARAPRRRRRRRRAPSGPPRPNTSRR